MATVTIETAESSLSQLIARAEAGEEIGLARGEKPVARLVPFRAPQSKRRFGALRGLISVGPEYFEPLPEDELAAWE